MTSSYKCLLLLFISLMACALSASAAFHHQRRYVVADIAVAVATWILAIMNRPVSGD